MSSRTAQLVGSGIGAFAVPLIAYDLTGSVAHAGIIAAIGEVGGLVVTLPAGVVADRVDRRRLIIGCAVVGAAAWTWAAAAGVVGLLTGWQLAVVLFVAAVVTAFVNPAESGAIRRVVPTEQMHKAMAAVQGRGAVASLLGGPLGGLLYSLGRMVPVMANVVGEIFVAVATAFVRGRLNGDREAGPEHPVRSLLDGLRFCWSVPLLRTTVGLFAVINLTVNALVIAITLQLVRTGTTPFLIGLMEFATGGAALIGSVFAGRVLDRMRVAVITVVTLAFMAVCIATMAVVQQYIAFLALLAVPMLLVPALNAGLGGYVAAITPDRLQGRLSSVTSLTWLLAAPASPVLGSQLLAHTGLGATLWALAVALSVTVGLLFLVKPLWRIGRPETWASDLIT